MPGLATNCQKQQHSRNRSKSSSFMYERKLVRSSSHFFIAGHSSYLPVTTIPSSCASCVPNFPSFLSKNTNITQKVARKLATIGPQWPLIYYGAWNADMCKTFERTGWTDSANLIGVLQHSLTAIQNNKMFNDFGVENKSYCCDHFQTQQLGRV